jgi:hypothetical protein
MGLVRLCLLLCIIERERERESCKLVLGRKSSRKPLILGSFQFKRNWNFLVYEPPQCPLYFSNRSRHANSWDSKKTQLQVLVSKLSQTREYISVLWFFVDLKYCSKLA